MVAKTDTTPYHGHGKFYFTALVSAVLLFGVTTAMAWNQHIGGWELSLFHTINNWPEGLYKLFLISSIFHESLWIAVVAVVAAFLLRMYRLAWRLAVCSIAGYGVALLAKHIVGRPRPVELVHDVHARALESGMGFPSGHAMIMTVIALAILPYVPWRWRWLIPIPIVLMALSRIYLGVHLPLDVIGGFAVGLGVISFVRILPQSFKVALRLD